MIDQAHRPLGAPPAAPYGTVTVRRVPAVKRLFDALAAGAGVLLLSPVFAIVCVLIRLDSKGPALYRQTRVGRGGREFTMLKFRTMVPGNSSQSHECYVEQWITGNGARRNSSGAFKIENDPRVTRLGRFLRVTSMDEFPQLLNVLKGEMSLVGPRPPLPYEVAMYTARHARRLGVLPGMTGLWQVSGRNETTFEEMVDLDLEYIRRWSLSLDLRILANTISVVTSCRGG